MHRPGRIRSRRWLAVARACDGRALTVPAIARELGVAPGSIQSLVASLKREGILEETDSAARGRAVTLTVKGRQETRRAEELAGASGLFANGERLVIVVDKGAGIGPEALGRIATEPDFRWAARIDGTAKWIISFGQEGREASERAVRAVSATGAEAVTGRADVVLDAEELAEYAREVAALPAPRKSLGALH